MINNFKYKPYFLGLTLPPMSTDGHLIPIYMQTDNSDILGPEKGQDGPGHGYLTKLLKNKINNFDLILKYIICNHYTYTYLRICIGMLLY